MKIYALNGMQSHSESVKRNVSLVSSVVLRGIETDGDIQLLEGSHRMAYAIELGLPVTIVLFGENEIIPHDCDDIISLATGVSDRSTARELAHALIAERGLYNQSVYESNDYPNINIFKPIDETGKTLHLKLISNSPFSAFPEKVWVVTFGEVKDVVSKEVLVIGRSSVAEAFKALGAVVTFVDIAAYQDMTIAKDNKFDLIYTTDIYDEIDLHDLFSLYRNLLKPEGLAVTLNEKQTFELISSVGLNIYAIFELKEESQVVSFVRLKHGM